MAELTAEEMAELTAEVERNELLGHFIKGSRPVEDEDTMMVRVQPMGPNMTDGYHRINPIDQWEYRKVKKPKNSQDVLLFIAEMAGVDIPPEWLQMAGGFMSEKPEPPEEAAQGPQQESYTVPGMPQFDPRGNASRKAVSPPSRPQALPHSRNTARSRAWAPQYPQETSDPNEVMQVFCHVIQVLTESGFYVENYIGDPLQRKIQITVQY